MSNDGLKRSISEFSGNIQGAFNFLVEIHKQLNFDLDFNFNSSTAFQRFTNLVRNMISRGLIQKPIKSGRSLILDERIFLELLVARKYNSAGCSMDSLSGYLIEMSIDDLYERLFAKHLPDIDKVAARSFVLGRKNRDTDIVVGEALDTDKSLFHHIKVGTGLFLHVQHRKFSQGDIASMIADLEEYVKVRPRRTD